MSDPNSFSTVIQRVVNMPRDRKLCNRIKSMGLDLVNVMWEDTARTPGSVWGDNISDMTLQVRHPQQPNRKELLPVIRYPNFTDRTGDVPLDLVKIKVGNEKGEQLRVITLREYLTHLQQYISNIDTFHPDNQSLITAKDTHVLVSAQACFIPVPSQEKCSFNPVLFNYQSRSDSPAVLAIVISREGSSATIIDNEHDLAEWGQNLYFNNNGQKTCLTGERLSDYRENQAQEMATQQGISLEQAHSQVKVSQDVNMVMIVQVPLKHEELEYFGKARGIYYSIETFGVCRSPGALESSDVEDAVIGHGEDEGEHLELGR